MTAYGKLVADCRAVFNSGKTKTLEWRKSQLRAIVRMCDENADEFCAALHADLHKPRTESMAFEITMVKNEAINAINNLEAWLKPEKVPKNLLTMMDNCFIKREPFGVVLIIGAWNYPVQLVLLPLIGAVAAGNCAIIKPSEVSEKTASLFEKLIPKYMDPTCFHVVTGGVKETTEILLERYDYIFYTGNSAVGKIVMAAASKNLTPVTLELGGKSPVYVHSDADMEVTAKRLLWGKTCNAGQTCIAPDYVMCQSGTQDALVKGLKAAIQEFFNGSPKTSDSYGRVVNGRHYQRIKNLTEGGNVVIGDEMDEGKKYIGPTVLANVKPTDKVMQDEIFGPILPIMTVNGPGEAIDFINSREKPLAMYIFTKNSDVSQKFLDCTSSGGFMVNDTLVHAANDHLPFGGVGYSGTGSYHGKFSFDTFSHKRACVIKDFGMEGANKLRYPPYSEKKLSWVTWAMSKKEKRGRGIMAYFPFFIIAAVIAVIFKTFGMQEYLPKYLKKD